MISTTTVLLGIGYTMIGVSIFGIWKVTKDAVIVNKRKYRKIEENIREDERNAVYRKLGLNSKGEKE